MFSNCADVTEEQPQQNINGVLDRSDTAGDSTEASAEMAAVLAAEDKAAQDGEQQPQLLTVAAQSITGQISNNMFQALRHWASASKCRNDISTTMA